MLRLQPILDNLAAGVFSWAPRRPDPTQLAAVTLRKLLYAATLPVAPQDSKASVSRVNVRWGEPLVWVTRMQSPRSIWPVAIRFEKG